MCIDILKLIDAFPTIACNTIQMVMLARKCLNANVSCGPMEFNFQPWNMAQCDLEHSGTICIPVYAYSPRWAWCEKKMAAMWIWYICIGVSLAHEIDN